MTSHEAMYRRAKFQRRYRREERFVGCLGVLAIGLWLAWTIFIIVVIVHFTIKLW